MENPPSQPLDACPKYGCRDLFIRKDFPQKTGLLIVVIAGVTFLALAADPHRFYLGIYVLLAAVAIDALLYFLVPRTTVCYRCREQFRGVPINPKHGGFDLSIGEKYRQ